MLGSGLPVSSGVSTSTGLSASGSSANSHPDVDAQAYCRVADVDAGSLPFVVDTAFVPSGWMGDAPAYMAVAANPATGAPAIAGTTARMTMLPIGYTTIGDACSPDGVGRSSPNAKGGCWKVTFTPFPKAIEPGPGQTSIVGGGEGYGWAGAFWQYPENNWGTLGGGYPIPPGATTISVWARGSEGGEMVRLFTGEGLGDPCSDYTVTTQAQQEYGVGQGVRLASPPAWERYTIDITGLNYLRRISSEAKSWGATSEGLSARSALPLLTKPCPRPTAARAPRAWLARSGGRRLHPTIRTRMEAWSQIPR